MDVRSETGAAGQVESQVNAEPARLGDRVHEMFERRAAGEREIVSLGKVSLRNMIGGKPLDEFCDVRRVDARAVDESARA